MSAFGAKADIALGSSHLAFDPSGPPLFTLGYSLQANINTVTLFTRTVTVSSQHCAGNNGKYSARNAAHAMAAMDELFSGRYGDAIRRLRRAIELDPNSSLAHGVLSAAYAFGGEADLAIQQAQTALRLSPRDFLNVIWHITDAWAHLSAGRLEEAAECARRAIDWNPAFADAHGILAAASAHLGRMADAGASLDAFVRLVPGSLADQLAARPFRRPADRERYLAGLQKAGLSGK